MANIKKTVAAPIDAAPYVIAVFAATGFEEVERTATGGMHSEEKLLLTFEGRPEDYSEDYVAVRKFNRTYGEPYYKYYSIRIPEGSIEETIEAFQKRHEASAQTVEIKKMN